MATSGADDGADQREGRSQLARWTLVFGIVTVVALVLPLVASAFLLPAVVFMVSLGLAVAAGIGAMVCGLAAFRSRSLSQRDRRRAFVGTALGSLLLVFVALWVGSFVVLNSQANQWASTVSSQMEKVAQTQEQCLSQQERARASPASAMTACNGSQLRCTVSAAGTGVATCPEFAAATTGGTTITSDVLVLAAVLLTWGLLVMGAAWLTFGRRGPPLAGAAS